MEQKSLFNNFINFFKKSNFFSDDIDQDSSNDVNHVAQATEVELNSYTEKNNKSKEKFQIVTYSLFFAFFTPIAMLFYEPALTIEQLLGAGFSVFIVILSAFNIKFLDLNKMIQYVFLGFYGIIGYDYLMPNDSLMYKILKNLKDMIKSLLG